MLKTWAHAGSVNAAIASKTNLRTAHLRRSEYERQHSDAVFLSVEFRRARRALGKHGKSIRSAICEAVAVSCDVFAHPEWQTAVVDRPIQCLKMLFAALPAYIDWHWLWLSVAAFLGGLLNAVAGGGSFLLFPAMLSMRMLPIQANATNTVALWPGQLTSIAAYREDIRKNLSLALPMALAGLLGGTAGAIVLLMTPQLTFLHLVPWLLLIAALIFAVSGPVSRRLEKLRAVRAGQIETEARTVRRVPLFVATAAVCFYIGYFGAGAGFVLITLLSLFGMQDLHEINALKVVSTTMANGIAFLIFVFNGQVVWRYCLLAMIAAGIGGYTSASLARKVPQPVLRGLVVLIGLTMAAWFFWRNP